MIIQSTRLGSFLAWVFYRFVWNNDKSNQTFFFLFFSIALESENCDITKDDLNEYINNSNPDRTFFEQITDFGLGTSIIGRVSVQGVKSLGGHFACLCRGFEFYEVKTKIF